LSIADEPNAEPTPGGKAEQQGPVFGEEHLKVNPALGKPGQVGRLGIISVGKDIAIVRPSPTKVRQVNDQKTYRKQVDIEALKAVSCEQKQPDQAGEEGAIRACNRGQPSHDTGSEQPGFGPIVAPDQNKGHHEQGGEHTGFQATGSKHSPKVEKWNQHEHEGPGKVVALKVGAKAKRQLREYSKGMTRRIGVAQALINDPELVLLDEPTSGLDPIGTREMKDLIIDLKERGKTVILCSHLLADVEDVCDRIAVLHQGELKELGRVDELLRVTDITQIRTSGLPPVAHEEIRAIIQRHGGRDIEIGSPTTTLEDLFLEVVRDTEARPGRRARQQEEPTGS